MIMIKEWDTRYFKGGPLKNHYYGIFLFGILPIYIKRTQLP